MEIWGVIFLVFVLYLRTLKYNYIIDDNVKRNGYLYEVPEESPQPSFYKTRPSPWYRLFMISMHACNSALVCLLFGWQSGLVFAVHPIGVVGTAWVTGNYYATTAYFTLIGMWFLIKTPFLIGVPISLCLYTAALNSTITAISVPFVFLLAGPLNGTTWIIPLIMFLTGKRFLTGTKIRKSMVDKISGETVKFTWRRLAAMVKVMAFYICLAFLPIKLCFFREFGDCYGRGDVANIKKMESFNLMFWASLFLLVEFIVVGLCIHIFATCFFVLTIAAFSQYKILGQFVAERYLYLPVIGVCILLANGLPPMLFACLVTAYLIRTVEYTPCFKTIGHMYANDMKVNGSWAMGISNYAQHIMMDGPHGVAESHVLLQKALLNPVATYEIDANLAACYIIMQHYPNALRHTKQALVKAKGCVSPRIYNTLCNQEKELSNLVFRSSRFAPSQL